MDLVSALNRFPWHDDDFKHLLNLPQRAVHLIAGYMAYKAADAANGIDKCESQIEQVMLVALRVHPLYGVAIEASHHTCEIKQQHEIRTEDGRLFRVDFLISAKFDGRDKKLVVECDGYDFHERTKEQAERDRSRDRELTALGYTVLRFLGSEIWRDPFRCAQQVWLLLLSRSQS